MANERYVRFDANRAFYLATVAIALMGGSFAVGLRLGQDMPASLGNMFSGPVANDVAEPVLAPEQVVPVETYTFYDSQRALDREPREEGAGAAEPVEQVVAAAQPAEEPEVEAEPVRVIEREPVAIPERAIAEGEPSEPSGDTAEPEAADAVVAEPAGRAAPGRIERETVVRSMDEVDGF